MGFLTPIDSEQILANARGHRDLSSELRKDLYGDYVSVKGSMKNREKGKVLMPRNPFVFPDERLVLDEEFDTSTPEVRATFRYWRMFGIWLAPCAGDTLVYYDQFYWTPVAGAKRSAIGIESLNARGREVAKKRRTTAVVKIKAFGKSRTAAEWARDSLAGISDKTILKRIEAGWAPEPAITTPRAKGGRPRR